jgi:ParB-like chromosome segregation protein Spo0J
MEHEADRTALETAPKLTPGSSHRFEVSRVPVDQIVIEETRRVLNQDKVSHLAESIAEIGLRTPITVREVNGTPMLVTGQHRLEAAKKLGWSHIDAFIFQGDETDARLWELAENLFRNDLTVLERAESINGWLTLVEEKRKAGQAAHPGGEQPHDKGLSSVARELKITREEVRRAAKIAGISAEAKLRAREAGLADNQSALMTIAKAPTPEAQVARVEEIAVGRSVPRRTPSKPGIWVGSILEIKNVVPIPELTARPDETLAADQQAQLATLQTSWRIDGVLRREDFETVSAAIQTHFVRNELFGLAITPDQAGRRFRRVVWKAEQDVAAAG